ncbi:DNA polymerase III subunit chi [Parachlamydia acanthamoebae]|jgi:DNA polymerase-3 subunit chi|uniref:DNA polymerase III subunit chi n=2 Tax=Parachlamydia acanthamoebae TaxID=83552 RepID=F8KYD8_PARAV|nr:DNA polymerase III subunit chi [Parachlamydia acanthamoebae]KIA78378.1 hypothetical protein DB43_EC00060 [Parachlamydia acanthamoebae]CCB85875.1 putative uncharacterized protein [Parachlamydia acanthamoebae UV-7]
MQEKNSPSIHFLPAKNVREKLTSICETVRQHFAKQKRILIAAPNEEAARYLNALLWKQPEESFLPHIWSESQTEECVAITFSKNNVNQAAVLLNLCPSVHSEWDSFEQIYDLFDETDPEKQKASESRHVYYTEKGCQIHFEPPIHLEVNDR